MARVQASRGHDVTVVSVGARNELRRVDGINFRFLRCRTELPLRHLEFQTRALWTLRGVDPDVLHFHSQPEGAVLGGASRAAKVLQYDFFEFRGSLGRRFPTLMRSALNRFDVLMPCSQYCLDESKAHWSLDERRLSVLFNGVNTQQFRPDSAAGESERHARRLAGPVVLYVGRSCHQKGTDVLLEAFRILRARGSTAELAIAGPIGQFVGHVDKEDWPGMIRDAGGNYLGSIDESRLAAVYNMAHVVVMPTRKDEMFGMAAVEAMACGRPVVASEHGGLRETVPHECGGRFPVGDSAALADHIAGLISDPERWHRSSSAALAHAQTFSWESVCTRAEELYARALGIRGEAVVTGVGP